MYSITPKPKAAETKQHSQLWQVLTMKRITTLSSTFLLLLSFTSGITKPVCGFQTSPSLQPREVDKQRLPFQASLGHGDESPARTTRQQVIREQGGPLSFDTKLGALNPYAIYFGLVSIALGLCWFVVLSALQMLYLLTNNKIDPKRRMPVFFNHIWGTCLMRLTGNYPTIENADILQEFYAQDQAAMFVANHNSWMDIPFVGAAIGWRNYKFVAKNEMEKVPILGQAIVLAKSVLVDRTDRRSQLQTLKLGMQCLKDDVPLVTFPEGTRSKSGRMQDFKNGAFKMAHKTKSPVVPLSIVGSGKIMPPGWIFPCQPGGAFARVVVHPPIESDDKTEAELAIAVRKSVASGLPEDQKPEET